MNTSLAGLGVEMIKNRWLLSGELATTSPVWGRVHSYQ